MLSRINHRVGQREWRNDAGCLKQTAVVAHLLVMAFRDFLIKISEFLSCSSIDLLMLNLSLFHVTHRFANLFYYARDDFSTTRVLHRLKNAHEMSNTVTRIGLDFRKNHHVSLTKLKNLTKQAIKQSSKQTKPKLKTKNQK